jgi:hypothetical protein
MNEPTAQRSAPSGHKTQLQAPTLRVCAWTHQTAHHYVCQCLGYPEIAPVLIECGTDINARDRSDLTQLDDVLQDWHLGL